MGHSLVLPLHRLSSLQQPHTHAGHLNCRPHLRALLLLLLPAPALAPAQSPPRPAPTITATTTLVLAPTLVRSLSGDLIPGLRAEDFRLTDNGVPQIVSIEDTTRQPLAVVVLMQTGASAPRQFANYRNLTPLLENMMGSSAYRVALVTFDSQPEEIWNFPPRVDGLSDAFTHPEPGDGGAAILDAVNMGIDLLEQQPPASRRILLLLSQPDDVGSRIPPADIIRRLGTSNTTIYSVTYSPQKAWLKDQFTKPRHGNPPYQLGPMGPAVCYTFDLGTPLGVAVSAMHHDTAAEIATLSGGEHLRFSSKLNLERELASLANHIPNAYTLSFHPTSVQPGFHALHVEVLHQPAGPLSVTTRTGYWSGPPAGDRSNPHSGSAPE